MCQLNFKACESSKGFMMLTVEWRLIYSVYISIIKNKGYIIYPTRENSGLKLLFFLDVI